MGRLSRKEKKAAKAAAAETAVEKVDAAPVKRPKADVEGDAESAAPLEPAVPVSWSQLWQVPAIAVSVLLIGAGVYTAIDQSDPPVMAELLDEVERYLEVGQYETAAGNLEQKVKPLLHEAGRPDRARFHAIVGDWIGLTQEAHNASIETNNRLINEQYEQAAQLGYPLGAERIERWALALVALGEIPKAKARLLELESLLSVKDGDESARHRRNNLYRKIVEYNIRYTESPIDEMLAMLDDFRRDQLLDVGDEAWAVARQAELRINHAMAQEAIDYLLIEMRRIESRLTKEDRADFGELYMLLGKAYQRVGNNAYAQHNLNIALSYFSGPEPARGWTLVLLGQLAVQRSDFETALLHFEAAVRDFEAADCYGDALLGRAELYSVLGQHDESISDYENLRDRIIKRRASAIVSREQLVNSVVRRHDASLTMHQLETARRYIDLVRPLFTDADMPAHVLFRMASTSRQLADDKLAAASIDPATSEKLPLDRIDPAVRADANVLYKEAADAYVRHARAMRAATDEQDAWADSLWMAGDSYDLAGLHEEAAALFGEYVSARSEIDPRRPEGIFRLAQSHQALMQFEQAAERYQQLIDQHPRSAQATASFVPLARTLVILERRPEAVQLLTRVVNGHQVLEPEAVDYRDALIQLGVLYYDSAQYPEAIKYLSDAGRRYPADPRVPEVRFRLADAHRRFAKQLDQQAMEDPSLSPAARLQLQQQRDHELDEALNLFSQVVSDYGAMDQTRLNALQLDFRRRAYLYRADCAFQLHDYERAISMYDDASRRYADQHSSLIALVQIVNCYYAMNDPQRAHTAEQRARVRLKQLPDDAFKATDALMDRDAWERWLQHSPPGQALAAAAE